MWGWWGGVDFSVRIGWAVEPGCLIATYAVRTIGSSLGTGVAPLVNVALSHQQHASSQNQT